eukprot:g13848.t1
MVQLVITADSWDSVWKVKRQLDDLNIPEPDSVSINGDGKIFLKTSMEALFERVVSFDRLKMQQEVRDALHEILPHFGCEHHPHGTLMVYVFLSATLGFVGVPLFHRRVKQGYFPHKGLHHSLCWGLAATAALEAAEVVVDPMAGKGVVLLEAAAFWSNCSFLGFELEPQQLAHANENLSYARGRGVLPLPQSIGFVRADCRRLPLAASSVDVVLCDLPYGRQYGTEAANHELYAAALLDIARVLKPSGRSFTAFRLSGEPL